LNRLRRTGARKATGAGDMGTRRHGDAGKSGCMRKAAALFPGDTLSPYAFLAVGERLKKLPASPAIRPSQAPNPIWSGPCGLTSPPRNAPMPTQHGIISRVAG